MSEQIYMMQISEIEKQNSQITGRWPLNEFMPVVLASDYETLQAECERLRGQVSELFDKKSLKMGVGTGGGMLFVHGDYESIKAAQAIVLERDAMRAELAALKSQEPAAWSLKLPGGRTILEKRYPTWIDDAEIEIASEYVATPLYAIPTVNQHLTVRDENKD